MGVYRDMPIAKATQRKGLEKLSASVEVSSLKRENFGGGVQNE